MTSSTKDGIIILNAGSSSLKFKIFYTEGLQDLTFGQITGIGTAKTKFVIKDSATNKAVLEEILDSNTSRADLLAYLLDTIKKHFPNVNITTAGHRVVHGGSIYTQPTIINQEVINNLKTLQNLSPIHLPHNIAPMEILLKKYPTLKQVACFDTAFHSTNPDHTRYYAIPKELIEEDKLLRYGFHGLSYEYIASKLKEIEPTLYKGKTIVCHLGAGASVCALNEGKSFTTSMGFTPLDGLVMGSRCGSIDPGILLYLMNNKGYDAKQLEDLLYYKSGILGLSGISSDFYSLEISPDPLAKQALDIFCYNLVKVIGSYIVALGGVDGIVFTAGVGENASDIREYVGNALAFLGVKYDNEANKKKELVFSTPDSKIKMLTIPTNEELMIAQHTLAKLK
jgi:acetate kinase